MLIGLAHVTHADDEAKSTIALSFAYPKETGSNPNYQVQAPVIYVGGHVAGAVPGTVEVPLLESGVAVEIGLPQLRQLPLYSMIVDVDSLKRRSIKLTASSFKVRIIDHDDKTPWNDFGTTANDVAELPIEIDDQGHLRVTLPVTPFVTVTDFIHDRELVPFSTNWYSNIPVQNYDSSLKSDSHVVATKESPIMISNLNRPDEFWSGGYSDKQVTLSFGFPGASQRWIIRSEPTGATVRTEVRKYGDTLLDATLQLVQSSYIILHKDGYFDGVYLLETGSNDQCVQTVAGGVAQLTCKLKAIPQNP
jgi:hypothetical protein